MFLDPISPAVGVGLSEHQQMLVASPKLNQDDTARALGENKATTPSDPAQATGIWSLLTRCACFFWLICMGHRTNRDAWVDARRQAGHEVVVDAAPAEKPGTEQDW